MLLRVPEPGDLRDLFALYSDPAVWADDPRSRHTDLDETKRMIERWRDGWKRDGLGMWFATSREPSTRGQFVGIGGCFVRHGAAWNLGYRLRPGFWGRGLAREVIAAAVAAARELRHDLAVTAYMLEGNERSRRTAESAGLELVWHGPDAGNHDPDAKRLLYADRDLPAEVLRMLISE
jgi:RimJ/RimL family protein N-acetyltransferase